jgi:DNA-binding transcriptional LysR family regulator
METLTNLESFVRSAELGGFSAAARRLGLTPAAVSRNVAMLERNLGVRLFHRSTRKLTLTEVGDDFLNDIRASLDGLQVAIAGTAANRDEPAGVIRVSMPLAFGTTYILPLLPPFLARYPLVRVDWRFESNQVDLVAEGFDAAIGGGFELRPGLVARTLAPAHLIAVASPAYMKKRKPAADPAGLSQLDGIVMRSTRTGRAVQRVMRNAVGVEMPVTQPERLVLSDSAAMCSAAVLGLGVALLVVPDALPHLESRQLIRLCPQWYADLGPISLYYASRTLLPAKTRAFIELVSDAFRRDRLAERFAGSVG